MAELYLETMFKVDVFVLKNDPLAREEMLPGRFAMLLALSVRDQAYSATMPTPRQSAVLYAEIVNDPALALRKAEFWREPVCRRWLDHVDELVHHNRRNARAAGVLGVRLALRIVRTQGKRRIRNRCVFALATATLASVHRAAGNLDRAGVLLTRAERIARTCRDGDTWAELRIRRAYWALYAAQGADGSFDQAMLAQARHGAEEARRLAQSQTTKARAHNCLGSCTYYQGEFGLAADEAKAALSILDALERPYDLFASLSVLVVANAKRDEADHEETAGFLVQMQHALPPRSSELRARLKWAEALVLAPNRRRRGRCRRLLSQALTTFVRLEMGAEAVAVVAELARIRPTGPVPEWCKQALKVVDRGPVHDLLERLASVRMIERIDIAEQLRELVTGPGLLPVAALPSP